MYILSLVRVSMFDSVRLQMALTCSYFHLEKKSRIVVFKEFVFLDSATVKRSFGFCFSPT